MEKSEEVFSCFNCGRSEEEVPLVTLRYAGNPAWICSQCFPTLIHKPQNLSDNIPNVNKIAPSDHEH